MESGSVPLNHVPSGIQAFEIVLEGLPSESLLDRLDGVDSMCSRIERGRPRSVLRARIADQAALIGLLNSLYSMRIDLIEVRRLESDADPPGQA
jgi:hypothetical protein